MLIPTTPEQPTKSSKPFPNRELIFFNAGVDSINNTAMTDKNETFSCRKISNKADRIENTEYYIDQKWS